MHWLAQTPSVDGSAPRGVEENRAGIEKERARQIGKERKIRK